MRGSKTQSDEAARVEYVPADATRSIELDQLFTSRAPLEVDLGCGDGSFIAALAAEHPGRNFLGVERLFGRIGSACRKIAARDLSNARIVRADIPHAATCLIPPCSVAVCHIMFPDPWPKRRHHRRRTVTRDLLLAIHRILVPGGLLRLTTDDPPYFEQMQEVAATVPHFESMADDSAVTLPPSTFEKRFVAAGIAIHRLVLRKVLPER